MEIIKTPIDGLMVMNPNIIRDSRVYFFESWNKESFDNLGLDVDFLQDNQSLSHKGVLRGLHFQNPPFEQGKLVRVVKGSVLDVAVDIRKDSATYGKHFSIELTGKNNLLFWIPAGFAHGFITLEDDTIFSYKCTNVYNKAAEGSLLWSDQDLNIDWKFSDPIVSEKDQVATSFENFTSQF